MTVAWNRDDQDESSEVSAVIDETKRTLASFNRTADHLMRLMESDDDEFRRQEYEKLDIDYELIGWERPDETGEGRAGNRTVDEARERRSANASESAERVDWKTRAAGKGVVQNRRPSTQIPGDRTSSDEGAMLVDNDINEASRRGDERSPQDSRRRSGSVRYPTGYTPGTDTATVRACSIASYNAASVDVTADGLASAIDPRTEWRSGEMGDGISVNYNRVSGVPVSGGKESWRSAFPWTSLAALVIFSVVVLTASTLITALGG
jgi:hypothetical protein